MAPENPRPTESSIRAAIGALGDNNFQPLMDLMDENVVWMSHAPASHFRWGGKHFNRSGVVELLSQIAREFSFTRFNVDDVVACADDAMVVSDVKAVHLATNRSAQIRSALRIKFAEGKVVNVEGFFDTAGVLEQLGMLQAA